MNANLDLPSSCLWLSDTTFLLVSESQRQELGKHKLAFTS